QRRAVDGSVYKRHGMRDAADVVLVPVRQHQCRDAALLLQIREIRNDAIDAEEFGIRKHHARVDDNRRLAPRERQHVHAELTESAERHDLEHPDQAQAPTADTLRAEQFSSKGAAARLNQTPGRVRSFEAGWPSRPKAARYR